MHISKRRITVVGSGWQSPVDLEYGAIVVQLHGGLGAPVEYIGCQHLCRQLAQRKQGQRSGPGSEERQRLPRPAACPGSQPGGREGLQGASRARNKPGP